MGACFDYTTFAASDEKTLKERFSDHQESLRIDNGSHAYAGHMGIAQGLTIHNKVFQNENEAIDYLEQNAQKWSSAIAVKVGDFKKCFPSTQTEKNELEKLNTLKATIDNWGKELIARAKSAKSEFRGCKKCGSKIATKFIKEHYCPVCSSHEFIETETDKKKYLNVTQKYKEQSAKVKKMEEKYKDINKKNKWVVGAWCAS